MLSQHEEVEMSILKSMKFVEMPKQINDPITMKRAKLISQLDQQRALLESPAAQITVQRWQKQPDGTKQLVEHQKRIKRWWRVAADGSVVLMIRYGNRSIEFEKGKTAITVNNKDKLSDVFIKLIEAAQAGEFDTHISSMRNKRR
jgi:hypothetical protein